ncbi:unnamed protein product [Notodromas monacha]|uniref:RRM domain-containing protein n=1 Tax=Notodromas monacha TaxID=399045 RepID=A0A7R9GAK9_9CRUS|nr:unnamed protein product [Notodromas monacha]CAG0914120.1 unnamed protein product [Notodromas monacha]
MEWTPAHGAMPRAASSGGRWYEDVFLVSLIGGVNDWGYGNDGWGGRGRVDSLGSGMGSRGGSSGLGGSGGYGGVGGMGSRGGGGSNWKSTGHVIRMRGLPFRATDADIKDFFKPLLPVSVHLDHNDSGKPTGEADVEFATYEDALRAMTKDRETMAHRYIELFIVGDGPSGGGGNSGGAPRLMNSGRSGGSNGNYGSGGNSVFSGGYDY